MHMGRWQVFVFLLPLLGLSWLLMTVLHPNGPPTALEYVIIGFIIGSMFGQATLASAWSALGPGLLLWRLPLSLGWIAVLVIAFLANVAIHQRGIGVVVALMMGACVAGQWLLVQIPLWGLAVGYGLRLRHCDDADLGDLRDRQFGIRQLLILTTIVAVVLGTCRWVLTATMATVQGSNWGELPIFAFLAVAGIVMTLPLLLAALLRRFAWLASAVVAALIAVATWWELPLLNMVGGPGPDIWHLIFINAFQAAWVLGVAIVVRRCGYGIGRPLGGCPFASVKAP